MHADDEEILTKTIKVLYRQAERLHLDKDIVAAFISDLQYIFHKDPKKRDEVCFVCGKQG